MTLLEAMHNKYYFQESTSKTWQSLGKHHQSYYIRTSTLAISLDTIHNLYTDFKKTTYFRNTPVKLSNLYSSTRETYKPI